MNLVFPRYIFIQANEEVHIWCVTDNNKAKWFYEPVLSNPQSYPISNLTHIEMSNVHHNTSGKFFCLSYFKDKLTLSETELYVYGKIIKNCIQRSPIITQVLLLGKKNKVSPAEQTVSVGNMATFHCKSYGPVKWYAECGMFFLSSNHHLKIRVDPYHQGYYQCQGIGKKGLPFIGRGLLNVKCRHCLWY